MYLSNNLWSLLLSGFECKYHATSPFREIGLPRPPVLTVCSDLDSPHRVGVAGQLGHRHLSHLRTDSKCIYSRVMLPFRHKCVIHWPPDRAAGRAGRSGDLVRRPRRLAVCLRWLKWDFRIHVLDISKQIWLIIWHSGNIRVGNCLQCYGRKSNMCQRHHWREKGFSNSGQAIQFRMHVPPSDMQQLWPELGTLLWQIYL